MMLWALLAGFSDLGDQLSAADYHAAIRMADE
jgi:hypothetical protein